MSDFDRLMDAHTPPSVPAGLAGRAVAAATARRQEAAPLAAIRRRNWRWTRPLWIGAASIGVAFTSAVAATVVSQGRIEIPVVQQVVEAIPVLHEAARRDQPLRVAAKVAQERPPAALVDRPEAGGTPLSVIRNERMQERIAALKQQVEQRRAAGLPTPRADRIEARATALVERRRAAGKPVPTIEQAETALIVREVRQRNALRRAERLTPSALTDEQVAQIIERLPAPRRQRLQALPPERQRQILSGMIERLRERRAQRPVEPESAAP